MAPAYGGTQSTLNDFDERVQEFKDVNLYIFARNSCVKN